MSALYRARARAVGGWIRDEVEEVRGGGYGYLTLRRVEAGPGSPLYRYLSRATGDEATDGPPGRRLRRCCEERERIEAAVDELAAAVAWARRS